METVPGGCRSSGSSEKSRERGFNPPGCCWEWDQENLLNPVRSTILNLRNRFKNKNGIQFPGSPGGYGSSVWSFQQEITTSPSPVEECGGSRHSLGEPRSQPAPGHHRASAERRQALQLTHGPISHLPCSSKLLQRVVLTLSQWPLPLTCPGFPPSSRLPRSSLFLNGQRCGSGYQGRVMMYKECTVQSQAQSPGSTWARPARGHPGTCISPQHRKSPGTNSSAPSPFPTLCPSGLNASFLHITGTGKIHR